MTVLYGTEVEVPPSLSSPGEGVDVCCGVYFTHSCFGLILCDYCTRIPSNYCALQRGEGSEAVLAQGQDPGCLL